VAAEALDIPLVASIALDPSRKLRRLIEHVIVLARPSRRSLHRAPVRPSGSD